jgi:tetratricopeptide (TPR) repeat protein
LGRWQESLQVLEEARPVLPSLENMARVLEIHARWNLGELDTVTQQQTLEELLEIARGPDVASGTAYLLAARLGKDTGDATVMNRVLDLDLSRTPDHSDRVLVLIGRAMLLFHLREVDSSFAIAREAEAEIARQQRADCAAVRLLMGLAALHVTRGDYEGAMGPLTQATKISRRLDNETLLGQVKANAAVTAVRIASYAEAIDHASEAVSRLRSPRASGYLIQALRFEGLAHALLQDHRNALRIIREGDSVSMTVTAVWRLQDWLLGKADILWSLGERPDAVTSAREATEGAFAEPGDLGCVGLHSRWVGRLALHDGDPAAALRRLDPLLQRLSRHDVLDNVEILATIAALHQRLSSYCPSTIREALLRYLDMLPPQTVGHLTNLDVF